MANRREKVEIVTDFLFLGSKITANGDWSREIRCLLLVREALTKLDSVLKSRDITQPTNVHIVKAIISPVVMHSCESWTVKKMAHEELNYGSKEYFWESLGQQRDQTSQS